MQLFLDRLFDALHNGVVYAALAMGLAIVYRASGHLNFAQGEMATFSVFVAHALVTGQRWPVALALPATVAVAATGGAFVERVLVRPLEDRNPLAVVYVTLALLIVLNSVATWLWFGPPRQFDSPYPDEQRHVVRFAGATLPHATIAYWLTLGGVVLTLAVVLRRTRLGLAFRAVASNRPSAALSGVAVGRVLSAAWALAAALAALAGIIAASSRPLFDQNLMLPLLVYALAALTVGGLDSPGGALAGGVVIALVETMVGGYVTVVGADLAQAVALATILVVLLVRPTGLFGRRTARRG